jgi:hypothetical protein
MNQEIRFLYAKKITLNDQLYKLHHECANKRPGTSPIILQNNRPNTDIRNEHLQQPKQKTGKADKQTTTQKQNQQQPSMQPPTPPVLLT